jgi:hypothetical protein
VHYLNIKEGINMSIRLTLKEEILNAIADGPRNLELFESYFSNFNLNFSRGEIINQLCELLDEDFVIVGYPFESKAEAFKSANNTDINDYWLDLTEKGREEQQKINLEIQEED